MFGLNMGVLDTTIMEARNFITAREMLLDGNWLLTTMNGEPRYQKPPLPTWLAAISAFFFELNNYWMRIPGFVMVIILALYNYRLSHKLFISRHLSLIHGFLTLTSFYIIGIVIEAPWDIFAHGFMLIAIYHSINIFSHPVINLKNVIIVGIFLSFSAMSKGPVSFYVLFFPFLIAYFVIFKLPDLKTTVWTILLSLLLALVLGGWWYLYVQYQDTETFLAITKKETSNWSSYNVRPFYYYWSFFVQSGIWTIPAFISLIYPYLKTRVCNLKGYQFTIIWTVIAVLLLSLIPEKKSRYLMPVLIPLALNTGFYIEYLIRRFKYIRDKRETIPVYFNFGLIGLIGLAAPIIGFITLKNTSFTNWFHFFLISLVLGVVGVFMIQSLVQRNIKTTFYLCVTFMASLFVFVIPLYPNLVSENYKSINLLKDTLDQNNERLYYVTKPSPEIIWDFGGKITPFDINNFSNFPKELHIIIQTNQTDNLKTLESKYQINYISTYDLNKVSQKSSNYKSRLSYQHYHIKLKEIYLE